MIISENLKVLIFKNEVCRKSAHESYKKGRNSHRPEGKRKHFENLLL